MNIVGSGSAVAPSTPSSSKPSASESVLMPRIPFFQRPPTPSASKFEKWGWKSRMR